MKKFLLAGIAAAAIFGAPALAADMPVKAPPAAVAPMFNWTGFYVGVEGGGGWGHTRHTNVNNGANSGTAGISGGLAGGTYGYNWQSGAWVLGLEGDVSWSGIKKTFASSTPFCAPGIECVTDMRWFGTDRVRLGYAQGPLLFYGTVGVAYGNVRGTLLNAGFDVGNKLHSGLTAGGGVEWAFAPNWSLKVEYLWADLGTKLTYGTVGTPADESVSLKNLNMVRVGLNYRFGGDPWGKAPVVAKY